MESSVLIPVEYRMSLEYYIEALEDLHLDTREFVEQSRYFYGVAVLIML